MPVRLAESSIPSDVSDDEPENAPLPTCTLLSVGQAFFGTQNVSSLQKDEAWRVNVITFWEGEIVDTNNFTFFTGKWGATSEDDIKHWTKFSSFSPLLSQVEKDGGKMLDLTNYPYIFMRWKEQYFVNVGTDCGLTIAGFYYVCFSCGDGSINGYYYDPNSSSSNRLMIVELPCCDSPFQKLELKSTKEGRSGFSFGLYELK